MPYKILFFFCIFVFGSCSLKKINKSYEYYLDAEYEKAADIINSSDKSGLNSYLMNITKANLLQYSGNIDTSIIYYNSANNSVRQLGTLDIIETAKSIMINKYISKYTGEYHERIYGFLFNAINYLSLKKNESAYADIKTAYSINDDYKVNSNLLNFLYALCADSLSEYNDALIEYKKLINNNYNNRFILNRLIYNMYMSGDFQSAEEISRKYNLDKNAISEYNSEKFLIVFSFNGNAPVKTESFVLVDNVKVSLPFYRITDNNNYYVYTEFSGTDKKEEDFFVIENLNTAIPESFKKQIASLISSETARAVLKNKAFKELDETPIGTAAKIFVFLTQWADLRCWKTLPANISISIITFPETTETCDLILTKRNDYFIVSQKEIKNIELNSKFNIKLFK